MKQRIKGSVAVVLALAAAMYCSVAPSLAASTCPSEPSLRSQSSTRATHITFLNKRAGVINVFWINYQGRRQFYRSLTPGQTASFNTFATHPWVVTDAAGNCLGVHFADVGSDTVTIR